MNHTVQKYINLLNVQWLQNLDALYSSEIDRKRHLHDGDNPLQSLLRRDGIDAAFHPAVPVMSCHRL